MSKKRIEALDVDLDSDDVKQLRGSLQNRVPVNSNGDAAVNIATINALMTHDIARFRLY